MASKTDPRPTRLLILFVLLPSLAGCYTTFRSTAPASAAAPAAPPALAAPETLGFDPSALSAVVEAIKTTPVNIHSLIVARRGQIVAEMYRPGSDQTVKSWYGLTRDQIAFDAQTLHDLRSISKSVTGLMVGIVLAENPGVTVDTPAAGLFPELTNLDAAHQAITIRHLLTMSSGLEWSEWGRGTFESDETGLSWDSDPVRSFFSRPVRRPPGQWFNYSGGSTQVLMRLVEILGKAPFTDQVKTRLFGPLGIAEWEWVLNSPGKPLAYSGLRLTPRDLVKLGSLMLQQGQWEGRQLVPAAWVAATMTPQVATEVVLFSPDGRPAGYGFQWWTGEVSWKDRTLRWTAAIGNGGQRLFLVPDLALTVVTTAGDYGRPDIQSTLSRFMAQVTASVEVP